MQSYGRHALWGMVLITGSLLANKAVSFIAYIALGWLLSNQDFKLWGMLLSLRVFVDGVRHGGVLPVMQQRGDEALADGRRYYAYALVINVLSAASLLALLPFTAYYFPGVDLTWLVLLMAVGIPLQTPGAIHRVQLSVKLKFGDVAKMSAVVAVINYGAMVLLAACGLGPYALAWSLIILPLAEWILFRWVDAPIRGRWALSLSEFRELFGACKWVMLSTIVTSIGLTGDYLVIGRRDPDDLGAYLFGFQLTFAFSALIVTGIQQVLLPTFAKLQHDRARLADGYHRSMLLTALVCSTGFAMASAGTPLLVHHLWAGKWDDAIPVAQVMCLCLILRVFNPLAASALQAIGRWDLYAIALTADAVGVLVGAWVGTSVGRLPEIAIGVGLGRCVAMPIVMVVTSRALAIPLRRLVCEVGGRIIGPIAAVIGLWWVYGYPVKTEQIGRYSLAAAASLLIAFGLMGVIYRRDAQQLLAILRRRAPTVASVR